MRPATLLSVCLLALSFVAFGCDKGQPHANAIGACNVEADCSISFTGPEGVSREIRCKGPKTKLPLACSCVENSVVGKQVELTSYPSGLDEAKKTGATACGW